MSNEVKTFTCIHCHKQFTDLMERCPKLIRAEHRTRETMDRIYKIVNGRVNEPVKTKKYEMPKMNVRQYNIDLPFDEDEDL